MITSEAFIDLIIRDMSSIKTSAQRAQLERALKSLVRLSKSEERLEIQLAWHAAMEACSVKHKPK